MNETNASTRAASPDEIETLSISEAATRYGVSVRTVQRRLDAGTWEAVFEGDARRVRARDTTRQSDAPEGATQRDVSRDSDTPQGDSGTSDTTNESEATRHRDATNATDGAPQRDTEGDTSRDMARHLLAEKDARIADLQATVAAQRAQIEAAQRNAAESAAALREYLKISAKALPSREYSQPENSAQNSAEAPKNGAAAKVTGATKAGGKRAPRSIWRVILGLR